MKKILFLYLFIAVGNSGLAQSTITSLPHIVEAERQAIKCQAGQIPGKSIWSSGGMRTPDFWGRAVNDEIQWSIKLPPTEKSLKLAVRYSYAKEHHLQNTGQHQSERKLELTIDRKIVIPVSVPDTGWWEHFQTTHILLPPLKAGEHSFRLRSTMPHMTTNIDCAIFYTGSPDQLPPALRKTRIAKSKSKRFTLLMTPKANPGMTPNEIFLQFDRIFDYYKAYIGWAPPLPIQIHVIEEKLWDNPGATAYQNQWGVFFKDRSMATDQGNWLHEMTHMFYCAHFPYWFDESSVQMLTTFNWAPNLYPQVFNKPHDKKHYQNSVEDGRRVLNNTSLKVDHFTSIQYALWLKYGEDAYRRFFHLCVEAGRNGKLDFTPGRHLTSEEIVYYFSKAVNDDVRPLFEQWKDFI